MAEQGAEVVIDLTCYKPSSVEQLVEALRGRVGHFLHCGTIWVHGHSVVGHSVAVPTKESAPRAPFGDYGIRKLAIETYLLNEARTGFPATVLHPGHLVGPGWVPINPAGNFNLEVFANLAAGREVLLPDLGMETLHHVHAADVASAFVRAVDRRDAALGESFHVVSPAAVTLRGYAERMAAYFGREPNLRFVAWEEWRMHFTEKDARTTWDHLARSPHCVLRRRAGSWVMSRVIARSRLWRNPSHGWSGRDRCTHPYESEAARIPTRAPSFIMGVIVRTLVLAFLLSSALLWAQRDIPPGSLNRPERLEWFRDQGFGLFIHWSVDSQTGVVISHSLAGADEAYMKRV